MVKIANRNLLRNKLRTFLTIMAIFVGSFTLVLTNGLADGMRDFVDQQIKSNEADNVLFVRRKFDEQDDQRNMNEPQEYKEESEISPNKMPSRDSFFMTLQEIEALKSEIPSISGITPRYNINGSYVSLDGVKKYFVMLNMLSEGVKQKVEVGQTTVGKGEVIIPNNLAKTLNPEIGQLVGRNITIGYKIENSNEMRTVSLRIAGVATKGLFENLSAYIDSETTRKIYEDQKLGDKDFNKFSSFTILLDTNNEQKIQDAKAKLAGKGFEGETIADKDKRGSDGIVIIQLILGFFAFIALIAASFGIVNTLVVAVMERTKEIGLQKALGMGRWKVFALFSLESVLIGFWGAILGVVVGIFVGKTANFTLASYYAESFEGYSLFSFHLFSLVWVTLLVTSIAFFAGVLPAYRASRLHPIEALRYE